MNGAVEIELKLQAPAAARAALRRAFATSTSRTLALHAQYLDTADDRLAAAGYALRLRREGRRWVQTLKSRGDGLMARPEHEVPLGSPRATPDVDIARHAGTAAGDALAALLADGAPLVVRFATEVRRRVRVMRHAGARVEVAYDDGRIVAGDRVLPVHEVEFELLAGPPAPLAALAAEWSARHGLWLDARTKSERGLRLARGEAAAPLVKSAPVKLPADASTGQAFAAMVQAVLAHLLPNAAAVAAGDAAPEHLHQVRVALRRLRTLLRLYASWSADTLGAHALEAALREPFSALGATRDDDVIAATLLPALAAAGGPPIALPPSPPAEPPGAVLQGPAFNAAVLGVLALALAAPVSPAAGAPPPALAEAVEAVLAPVRRQVRRGARSFADDDAAARHRTRRRLKRLRYATEFVASVLPRRPTRAALAAMSAALDALGAYNDAAIAEARFRDAAAADPHAWFAVGWLAARQQALLKEAAGALRRLRRLG